MGLVIRGGTLWTEDGPVAADLHVGADGRISHLTERGEHQTARGGAAQEAPGPDRRCGEDEVFDATGLWVLPGGVDAHVHFREPGMPDKEDFLSGSASAAVGGVTTVLDMPNTIPPVIDGATFQAKKECIEGRSHVDYALFTAVVADPSDAAIGRVQEAIDAGAVAVKVFLGPTTGDLRAPGWGTLYRLCRALAGKTTFTFHSEDRDVIDEALSVPPPEGTTYKDLLTVRTRFGELLATDGVLRLALETGARLHVAHVALVEAVEAIARAKEAGARVTAETCPHYLYLSEEDYQRLGPAMKVLPPIRSRRDQRGLWDGLHSGALDFIATDHAPHPLPEVAPTPVWSGNFGMSGVQTLLPVLLNEAVAERLHVRDVVRWTSTAPAKTYGLYPQKGALFPGSDADIVIVDPTRQWTVDGDWWRGKSKNTAFWGQSGFGLPVATFLRGKQIVGDGAPTAAPSGRFLAPREGYGHLLLVGHAKGRRCCSVTQEHPGRSTTKDEDRLRAIRSKEDLTLEDVYELGLEHDQENLKPEKTERKSRIKEKRSEL